MAFHAGKWMTQVVHKMKRQDLIVLLLEITLVGLLLAKLFPILSSHHRGYYVVLIIAAEIYFYMRLIYHKHK